MMISRCVANKTGALRSVSRPLSSTAGWELKAHPSVPKSTPTKPLVVAILDGVGVGKPEFYDTNAVHVAHTPTLDRLSKSKLYRTLVAHGKKVGLPTDADMGNSEVGHNAIGCGRIVKQGAALVDDAIANKSIFTGDGWNYIKPAFESNTLHFIGLLSDGGVHSRINQLISMLKGAAADGAKRIRVHVLLDGRDVPDGTCIKFTQELEAVLTELESSGCDAKIASGGGRMYVTMDRYNADWSIVERGWHAHVLGQGREFNSCEEACETMRSENSDLTDQNLPPFVVVDEDGAPLGTVENGDAVVCFNFRGDRAIEISKAFEDGDDFKWFDRIRLPETRYAGLMEYDGDDHIPKNYLVAPPLIDRTSGEYLAKNGMATFAISETQKFGHVTYFWNGNKSGYFDKDLEEYCEIPSDKISFDLAPDMKAHEIAAKAADAIRSGKFNLVRLNLANGDMVGHTGNMAASVQAMTTVDAALTTILNAVEEAGGAYIVTADHGNADEMVQRKKGKIVLEKDGSVAALTSHTLAPVPLIIGGPAVPPSATLRDDLPDAGIANITATMMNLMGYEAPEDYEQTLLKF